MVRAVSISSIAASLAVYGLVGFAKAGAGDLTAALSLDDECGDAGGGDSNACALELAQLRVARHVKAAPAMVERGLAIVKGGFAMVEEMKDEVENRAGFAAVQNDKDDTLQPVVAAKGGAVPPFPQHSHGSELKSEHAAPVKAQEPATLVSHTGNRGRAEHLHIGPAKPEDLAVGPAASPPVEREQQQQTVKPPHSSPEKQPTAAHATSAVIAAPAAQALNSYGHPKWVQECKVIFIDVGANNGVSIRKMFEPKKYPEAELLDYLDNNVGSPSWRRAGFSNNGVCGLGLEPNPVHQNRLNKIEKAYAQNDWRVHFYPLAAWSRDGEMLFNMTGPRLPDDGSDDANAGAHLDMNNLAQADGLTTVRTVNFAKFVESLPAGTVKLIQMDIEGAEYETLAQLMTENKLCKSVVANLLVAPHDWGEIRRWGKKSSFPNDIHPRSMSAIGSRVDQMTEMGFCDPSDNVTYIAEFDDTSFDDDVDDAFGQISR